MFELNEKKTLVTELDVLIGLTVKLDMSVSSEKNEIAELKHALNFLAGSDVGIGLAPKSPVLYMKEWVTGEDSSFLESVAYIQGVGGYSEVERDGGCSVINILVLGCTKGADPGAVCTLLQEVGVAISSAMSIKSFLSVEQFDLKPSVVELNFQFDGSSAVQRVMLMGGMTESELLVALEGGKIAPILSSDITRPVFYFGSDNSPVAHVLSTWIAWDHCYDFSVAKSSFLFDKTSLVQDLKQMMDNTLEILNVLRLLDVDSAKSAIVNNVKGNISSMITFINEHDLYLDVSVPVLEGVAKALTVDATTDSVKEKFKGAFL